MDSIRNVLAIDGPAGCGKSTITKILADKFDLNYIDTGALFRATSMYLDSIEESLERTGSIEKIVESLKDIKLDYGFQSGNLKLVLNGTEVQKKIREHHVSALASKYSKLQEVRDFIESIEKDIASRSERVSVVEGRDIGTIIFPQAKLKIFLTASSDVRAKRRFSQLKEKGSLGELTFEKIKTDIETRDEQDRNRKIAPLQKADDAIEVDTSDMSIDEVVKKVSDMYTERFL